MDTDYDLEYLELGYVSSFSKRTRRIESIMAVRAIHKRVVFVAISQPEPITNPHLYDAYSVYVFFEDASMLIVTIDMPVYTDTDTMDGVSVMKSLLGATLTKCDSLYQDDGSFCVQFFTSECKKPLVVPCLFADFTNIVHTPEFTLEESKTFFSSLRRLNGHEKVQILARLDERGGILEGCDV